jgi:predicted naringenin-chalcone synthase
LRELQTNAILSWTLKFYKTSFEERNDIYSREVIDLGEKVLDKALKKSGWKPEDLDYIITVSCTGIMIPSLDAYLINKLKLRQDIVRSNVDGICIISMQELPTV